MLETVFSERGLYNPFNVGGIGPTVWEGGTWARIARARKMGVITLSMR
jgi:hypothetical protein